jgi:hypothetical protein
VPASVIQAVTNPKKTPKYVCNLFIYNPLSLFIKIHTIFLNFLLLHLP